MDELRDERTQFNHIVEPLEEIRTRSFLAAREVRVNRLAGARGYLAEGGGVQPRPVAKGGELSA
jgi:hypothetical protein